MTRQENLQSGCDSYRVVATDNEDKSYFIVRVKNNGTAIEDCCWCKTDQPVALGELIEGYLNISSDLGKIPMLVVK